ncbi:MAG: ComEC/Rec2 family competence protein [Flavobacteriales bacterium]
MYRASLMLSIYYLFVLMRRRYDMYHTLVLLVLILLVISQNYLFNMGFKLSYLDMFSIGYLYGVFRH